MLPVGWNSRNNSTYANDASELVQKNGNWTAEVSNPFLKTLFNNRK